MKRRTFLRHGLLSVAGFTVGGLVAACQLDYWIYIAPQSIIGYNVHGNINKPRKADS